MAGDWFEMPMKRGQTHSRDFRRLGHDKGFVRILTKPVGCYLDPTRAIITLAQLAEGMGGPGAPRTVEQGAAIAVRLATLFWMGPTGGFYHDNEGPNIAPYDW
ncbi:hypothetical protein ATO67_20220 [Agrobacterium bohemicum]|uniref:Uncharacterized protein n=2 Tax=Agrobacterium bohemicum TaxID=2052828 RepID=A0A135P7D1_9HYPH|nr:hypothetical protein ATO67_20220 [Agrobacterium bohemicum]